MDYGPYKAKVIFVHDGDTVGLNIDLGFSQYLLAINPLSNKTDITCRLYGINAPELWTEEGKASAYYLKQLLPVDTNVMVLSHGYDKYGARFDGTISLLDGTNINEKMVADGYAKTVKYK
jgi:endonuclease YncB( thermonuclease family)